MSNITPNGTPENQANSWHDLADQLTPDQMSRLERIERCYRDEAQKPKRWWSTAPRSDSDIARLLLHFARTDAAENLRDVLFAGVALPAGAVSAYPWGPEDYRVFQGEECHIEDDIRVWTHGIQHTDGRIDDGTIEAPAISVDGLFWEKNISSETARHLANVLIAAADEVEAMNGYDEVPFST